MRDSPSVRSSRRMLICVSTVLVLAALACGAPESAVERSDRRTARQCSEPTPEFGRVVTDWLVGVLGLAATDVVAVRRLCPEEPLGAGLHAQVVRRDERRVTVALFEGQAPPPPGGTVVATFALTLRQGRAESAARRLTEPEAIIQAMEAAGAPAWTAVVVCSVAGGCEEARSALATAGFPPAVVTPEAIGANRNAWMELAGRVPATVFVAGDADVTQAVAAASVGEALGIASEILVTNPTMLPMSAAALATTIVALRGSETLRWSLAGAPGWVTLPLLPGGWHWTDALGGGTFVQLPTIAVAPPPAIAPAPMIAPAPSPAPPPAIAPAPAPSPWPLGPVPAQPTYLGIEAPQDPPPATELGTVADALNEALTNRPELDEGAPTICR